jgi:uncharacterized protein (TIGR00251 family)
METQYRLFRKRNLSLIMKVRVIPGSKKNGIAEILPEGIVKIRLSAQAHSGQANRALIQFLAKVLNIPKSNIAIISGSINRNKTVSLTGIENGDAEELILSHLSG